MVTITTVKKQHECLYSKALREYWPMRHNTARAQEFVTNEVERLLTHLEAVAKDVETIDDYTRVNDAAVKWDLVLAAMNVQRRIQVSVPARPLTASEKLSQREVLQWVAERAYYLSRDREIRMAREFIARIFQDPRFIVALAEEPRRLREMVAWGAEEQERDRDWLIAGVFFASYVLDGTIHLSRGLEKSAYERLESVWLDDVKSLRAYFRWQARGNGIGEDQGAADYLAICDELSEAVMRRKDPEETRDFEASRRYIEKRYLYEGARVRADGAGYELIKRKAQRLYETMRQPDDVNWHRAERYARQFYGNIIPAVADRNQESERLVIEATVGYTNTPKYYGSLVNCFEAGLVIYFVEPE